MSDRLGGHVDPGGGQQDAHRFPVAAARGGEVVPGQGLAGGPDGVEVVGLGAVAAGRPGRPVDLDDPLAVLEQEGGQPGAVAAGALDRPDPAAWGVLVGEGEDAPVAHRVGGALVVAETTPPAASTTAAVLVSRWVSTPMTWSTWPASMDMRFLLSVGRSMVGTGLGAVTARQDCDEARPEGRPGF